jgi:hypothetical protein
MAQEAIKNIESEYKIIVSIPCCVNVIRDELSAVRARCLLGFINPEVPKLLLEFGSWHGIQHTTVQFTLIFSQRKKRNT